MLGRKSIYRKIFIPRVDNPKHSYRVIVQANKNDGIYDILLPGYPKKPLEGDMEEYRKALAAFKARRSYLLNIFQGRQIFDKEVFAHLVDTLYNTLNETL